MVHAETFEVVDLEVFLESLLRGLERERPVLGFKDVELVSKQPLEASAHAVWHEHFLGRIADKQLVHIGSRAFAHKELARGNVQQRDADGTRAEVDGAKEIVLFCLQDVVSHDDARSNEFGDAALDQFLGKFRVLELVADGDAMTGADETREIGVERVVGETCHLRVLRRAFLVSARERDAEDLRGGDGIGGIGFIEIAAAKKQNGVRVLRFEVEELLHHRGEFGSGRQGENDFERNASKHSLKKTETLSKGVFYKLRDKERSKESAYVFNLIFRTLLKSTPDENRTHITALGERCSIR